MNWQDVCEIPQLNDLPFKGKLSACSVPCSIMAGCFKCAIAPFLTNANSAITFNFDKEDNHERTAYA